MKTHRIDGVIVFEEEVCGYSVCMPNHFTNPEKIFIYKPGTYSGNNIIDNTKDIVLYPLDIEYTKQDAITYLLWLLLKYKEIEKTNIMDLNRYKPIGNSVYYTHYECSARSGWPIAHIKFECSGCNSIDIGECAVCPIASGCPKCFNHNKSYCYMHTAEAIAAIILNRDKGRLISSYKGYVPYSRILDIFGKTAYDTITSIRDETYTRYFDTNGVPDTVVTISSESEHALNYISEKLVDIDINFTKDGSEIKFRTNKPNFNYIKNQIDLFLEIYSAIYPETPSINIETSECDPNDIDKNTYGNVILDINGITYGSDDCDVKDIPNYKSLGSPYNAYTYAVLRYMRPYITEGCSVLDLGCGRSMVGIFAHRYGAKYITGIDMDYNAFIESRAMIEKNIDKLFQDNFNIIYQNMFTYMDSAIEKYDVVVGNLVYSLQTSVLKEVYKLLKPNGIYILGGIHLLTERSLLDKIPDKLEVVEIKYVYEATVIILRKKDKES